MTHYTRVTKSYKTTNFSISFLKKKKFQIMATSEESPLPPHAFDLYLVDTSTVSFSIIYVIFIKSLPNSLRFLGIN